jgi:hypothetical protein
LATLAVVAAHTIASCDRLLPAPLAPTSQRVLGVLPVGADPRDYGPGLEALSQALWRDGSDELLAAAELSAEGATAPVRNGRVVERHV